MKIAAVCVTYLRPKQLGWLIRCFQLQDYADREMVILDDAGQYPWQQGDRWRLISQARRFPSLGAKRNAAVRHVSPDVEALAVWDDDDLYLPWALSASVAALALAPWSRPGVVLHPQADGSLAQHRTGGLYHGGWAYRTDLFRRVGGYPTMNNGEDQAFARRLRRLKTPEADPCQLGSLPFYVYTWGCAHASTPHLSAMGPDGYRQLGCLPREKTTLDVSMPLWLDLTKPQIIPGINERMF